MKTKNFSIENVKFYENPHFQNFWPQKSTNFDQKNVKLQLVCYLKVRFQLGTTKRKNPRWKWGERAGGEPAMYSTIVAISHKNHVFQRLSTPLH